MPSSECIRVVQGHAEAFIMSPALEASADSRSSYLSNYRASIKARLARASRAQEVRRNQRASSRAGPSRAPMSRTIKSTSKIRTTALRAHPYPGSQPKEPATVDDVDDVDPEALAEARQAQERLIEAEQHAEASHADFRRALRRLIAGGSSPRDIAATPELRRLIEAEQHAEASHADFRRAFDRLIAGGSSPRDIAAALELSNQQLDEADRAGGGSARGHRRQPPKPPPNAVALACTFCGKPQREVRKLIAGPGVYICDGCIGLTGRVANSGSAAATQLGPIHPVPEQDNGTPCNFCGKRRNQVAGIAAMSAGSGATFAGLAAICVECLSLCNEILAEELA